MKKYLWGEKGSVAVYVAITLFGFLIILVGIYFSSIATRKSQLKTVLKIKEAYELNMGDANKIYQTKLIEGQYNDNTLPTSPKLTKGMTKVKYNSTNQTWERVADISEQWYDYENKKWANVVLGDATFNADGTLDESQPYTQLVWIPRYAYKITSMYHQNGDATTAGNIEVVFIDTANKSKEGTTYSTTYPSATVGGSMSDFVVHPAFEYGGQHLVGIWVGKFESSHTGCTEAASTGQATYTGNEVMTIKAGVTSWRYLTVGNIFETCLNMNREENPYGLNTNDEVVDPHLLKNDEWGAVAYLSKSSYGKETEEVYINNNSSYITGIAGETASASSSASATNSYKTEAGTKASTNGDVTGIYDMSGDAWEYTAAYVNSGDERLTTNGGNLVAEGTADKYRNVYELESTVALSYQDLIANGHYGDAIYEISNSHANANGWYADYSGFPNIFFERGGYYGRATDAGVFSYISIAGERNISRGFRVGVVVF